MKSFKKALALFLTAGLLFSSFTAYAAEEGFESAAADGMEIIGAVASEITEEAQATEENSAEVVEVEAETPDLYQNPEVVWFNTGSKEVSVAPEGYTADGFVADKTFAADGSFCIDIAEEDPVFPYEVKFTSNGTVEKKWFMTPDDEVVFAGHAFRAAASFSGEVITSMVLDVAGQEVIAYPKEKEFTNGGSELLTSMLPMETMGFDVDLSAFTPLQLTMVKVKRLFAGQKELSETDKIAWSQDGNEYQINIGTDNIDLSRETEYGGTCSYTMYVGDADQLTKTNVKYYVDVTIGDWSNWLKAAFCKKYHVYIGGADAEKRDIVKVEGYRYYDYTVEDRELYCYLENTVRSDDTLYFALNTSELVPSGDTLKIYAGDESFYLDMQKMLAQGADVTTAVSAFSSILEEDAGLKTRLYYSEYLALVSYDAGGAVNGYLPLRLYSTTSYGNVSMGNIRYRTQSGDTDYAYASTKWDGNDLSAVYTVSAEADLSKCWLTMRYSWNSGTDNDRLTHVYAGTYASNADAVAAGAADIAAAVKDGTYEIDLTSEKKLTAIAEENGEAVYHITVSTEVGSEDPDPSMGTSMWVTGLNDEEEKSIRTVRIGSNEDSYGDYNFFTFIVKKDADLKKLAPVFSESLAAKVYAEGITQPLVSGKTLLDFSNGAVQLTVSSGDGETSSNYWLQVITASEESALYLTSFVDAEAKMTIRDGVIYSTREVMLDNYHGNKHDIFIANMGPEELANISVDLVSDQVALDDYWTFTGKTSLDGFDGTFPPYEPGKQSSYSNLTNIAKIRLKTADAVAAGTDVSGTLTIKAGGEAIAVLTLTGSIGNPVITTTEIPDGVLYVPYGVMIQNSNKYSWNTPEYSLYSGKLPSGMKLMKNGELYGVPTETGTFHFQVKMTNSSHKGRSISTSYKSYTFVIAENTDANVNAETDQGYLLKESIPDNAYNTTGSYRMVSEGVFSEFVDAYLDGEKLVPGTDYDKESGSTRITIKGQTLYKRVAGRHTLGLEFRETESGTLKKAAQNYYVKNSGAPDDPVPSGSSESSRSVAALSRSEYANPDKPAVGNWVYDAVSGRWTFSIRGLKVKNDWAYLVNNYAADGQEKNSWFHFDANGFMQTGWFTDTDGKKYYFWDVSDNTRGRMVSGTQVIDGKTYQFNEAHDGYFGCLK